MTLTTVNKIKVGIIGGAGYTGGELLRILVNHPQVEISFVNSSSNAGNYVYDVHTDLFGDTNLKFTAELADDIDVLFLCVGHGDARKFLEAHPIADHIKIIDLSQDFRLTENNELRVDHSTTRTFTYGLPELNRDLIKSSTSIANPGCFASSIELGLLPLAKQGLLNQEIHINATTGSTGAGQGLSPTSHFTWRNNNLSVYKAFNHQHLKEISETLNQLQNDFPTFPSATNRLSLIPNRGAFSRGIITSMYTDSALTQQEALDLYTHFYDAHPFTHVTDRNIDLKQVVNTNKCLIQVQKHGDKLLIVSIVDNLLKGASGQAVQNMNLMCGLDETTGLKLKANAF